MIGTLSPAGLPTAMTGLPLDALTEVPRLLGAALPAASTLAALPTSASPATAEDWFGVVDDVSRDWSGESADSAVASLTRAATGASVLDDNADVIDAAILVGTGAIVVAAADLAVLAAEFLTTAATTVAASAALGPAGLLPAATGLQTEATATLTAAVARLAQLESELAAPTSILESTVSTDVDLPAPPTPAGATSPTGSTASMDHLVPVAMGTAGTLTPASTGSPVDPASAAPSRPGTLTPTAPAAGANEPHLTNASTAETRGGAGAGSSESAPTPEAQAAVEAARSALGTPYQWGGNTPGVGLDCSGLTHWAYGQAGVDIPRTAAEQAVGRPVSARELLPGDLAVWDGHVAMIVGDGQMIEAGDPVQINPIRTSNLGMGFQGFWRPTG